jgi:hypothetical protein
MPLVTKGKKYTYVGFLMSVCYKIFLGRIRENFNGTGEPEGNGSGQLQIRNTAEDFNTNMLT